MSSARSDAQGGERRLSLPARLTVWYVLVFLLSVGALVAAALPAIRAALTAETAVLVETKVERHRAVLVQGGLPAYQEAVEQSAALEGRTAVRVRDERGYTLYEHGDLAASVRIASRSTREYRLDVGDVDDPWQAVSRHLQPALLVIALLSFALAIGGGFYVTRRALRPLQELAATARDVSVSGDLSRRVPDRGGTDELHQFTALFNRMLDRNQRLVRGMRDALDNVAHDLRTPLTRLRGSAELAIGNPDPVVARDALADVVEESDRVLAMLRTLMDISEAESGLMRLDRAPTSLARLARDTVDLYEQVAEEAGVELVLAEVDDVTVDVDATRIRQAIANLVDNGLKYTPRGGTVSIDVASDGAHALVRVRDTGEGIPHELQPRIWDRLYRADPSRSKPGLGLGLSLVQAIARAHGGEVTVDSAPEVGSTFTLQLPA